MQQASIIIIKIIVMLSISIEVNSVIQKNVVQNNVLKLLIKNHTDQITMVGGAM